jgi:hypothetical protein
MQGFEPVGFAEFRKQSFSRKRQRRDEKLAQPEGLGNDHVISEAPEARNV